MPSAETRARVLEWLAAQEAAAAAEWAEEEERLAAEEREAAEREGGALPFVRLPGRDGGLAGRWSESWCCAGRWRGRSAA